MPIDYKIYPANWREFSKDIRFNRAKNQCECVGECGKNHAGRCKAKNGDGRLFGKRGITLTVAHLWKHDCTHYNEGVRCANASHVKAMCEACHLAYDKEQHQQKRANNREYYRLRKQPLLFPFKLKKV